MAKQNYECIQCGKTYTTQKPVCSSCRGIDTIVPAVASLGNIAGLKTSGGTKPVSPAKSLSEISTSESHRVTTGINELDRVLGGGFVDGEVVLFAGAPGSGKSTLSLSVCDIYAKLGKNVLYSSGEESEEQIALRAGRMGVSSDNIKVIYETVVENLVGHIEDLKPSFVVVDSLQTLASENSTGSIGGTQQSKDAAHTLTILAKKYNITMVLINQIGKNGDFIGSESIQHIVDATLMFESDKNSPLKFLRTLKNRFGSTTEVGIFQHCETGLEEVSDPSNILVDGTENLPGAAVGISSEGMRQIPTEIQSLVVKSPLANPRRQFSGVDYNRGQIVCAIVDKYLSTRLFQYDVFISTVAGIKVADPLSDLAIAASLYTSIYGNSSTFKTCFIGELSLTGQVRGSFMMREKIIEAKKLGFERVVVPYSSKDITVPGITVIGIKEISKIQSLL